MIDVIFSILSIYIFIAIGYLAKRIFKEQIDDKTITIINVYFLQVFLTFWGLLVRPIDATIFEAPVLYFGIVGVLVALTAFGAKFIFSNKKEYSIGAVAALIGNTANLGIPLNIAIFGEVSIPYTTMINLVNIFAVYTIGVFYYSRGTFDTKTSLKNIFKLPILWAAIIAITLSLNGYKPSKTIMDMLQMGAYASIAMQLILFGIYMYGTSIKELNKRLIGWVMSIKFLVLPLVTFVVLGFFELESMIKGVLFMELIMPLAIANVNLASLYNCKPKTVTSLVLISSVAFLAIIFVAISILEYL